MFSKTNIYETGWIEVVFEGRNQGYGAFHLRKQESRTTLVSMLSVMAFFTVLLAIPYVFKNPTIDFLNSNFTNLTKPSDPDKNTEVIICGGFDWPPQSPSPKPDPNSTPKIVPDKDVEKTDTTTDKPAIVASTGTATTGASTAGSDTVGKGDEKPGIIAVDKKEDGNAIYTGTAIMPEFPGGDAALKQFITKMLSYPMIAVENGTQGKVVISAVVEKDGSISSISVISKKLGDGLEEEAVRVVGKMPNWTPGLQNGQPVRVRVSIPIKYQLKY